MLKRLKTDHIDLLYQHRVDLTVPIEDVSAVNVQLSQAVLCEIESGLARLEIYGGRLDGMQKQ